MYYTKADGVGGLWRRPPGTGDDREVQVSGPIYRYNFAPTNDGVYFIPRPAPARGDYAAPIWRIVYRDSRRDEPIDVVRLERAPDLGLTVSPDGKTLVYAQIDYRGADLQLVEGFH